MQLRLFIQKRSELFFHSEVVMFVFRDRILRSASGHLVATATGSQASIHLLHLCAYLNHIKISINQKIPQKFRNNKVAYFGGLTIFKWLNSNCQVVHRSAIQVEAVLN